MQLRVKANYNALRMLYVEIHLIQVTYTFSSVNFKQNIYFDYYN